MTAAMTAAVILAAGAGRRMGGPKALLRVGGETLLRRAARAALEAGCRFTIDSDAHYLFEFDNLRWGVSQARRGWLEARHVANTLPRDRFLALMAEKPHRV